MRLQRPRDFTPARTHMLLRLELEGESWLVDVGVGGLSPTCALRLVPDLVQETPHESRRIVQEGAWAGLALRAPDARLFHQASFADAWHDVCELTLEEMPAIDRELGNWFTSTHPDSHFKGRLLVARATPTGRIGLLDRELSVRQRGGQVQTRTLATPAELHAVLESELGLVLPTSLRVPCPGLEGSSGPSAES